MDAFQFRKLNAAPAATDHIAVYAEGTLNLVEGLVGLTGSALNNPFTITEAGGVDHWGFVPTDSAKLDVVWVEGAVTLARGFDPGHPEAHVHDYSAVYAAKTHGHQNYVLSSFLTTCHVPSGFLNHGTQLSLQEGLGQFTVTITGTDFPVFVDGKLLTKNTESITKTGAVSTRYFVFYAPDGTLTLTDYAWDLDPGGYDGSAPICTVMWDAVKNQGVLEEERHHSWRDIHWHHWAHHSIGSRYSQAHNVGGLALTNDATTFSVSAGEIYDEDIPNSIGQTTTCNLWYHHTDGTMTFDRASTLPYKLVNGVPQYDNGLGLSGKTASAQTGHFVSWVYGTNAVGVNGDSKIAVVVGQDSNGTMTLAEAQSAAEPVLPVGFVLEWKLIYKMIFRYNANLSITHVSNTDYRTAGTLPGGSTPSINLVANAISFAPTEHVPENNVQLAVAGLGYKTRDITDDTVTYSHLSHSEFVPFDGQGSVVDFGDASVHDPSTQDLLYSYVGLAGLYYDHPSRLSQIQNNKTVRENLVLIDRFLKTVFPETYAYKGGSIEQVFKVAVDINDPYAAVSEGRMAVFVDNAIDIMHPSHKTPLNMAQSAFYSFSSEPFSYIDTATSTRVFLGDPTIDIFPVDITHFETLYAEEIFVLSNGSIIINGELVYASQGELVDPIVSVVKTRYDDGYLHAVSGQKVYYFNVGTSTQWTVYPGVVDAAGTSWLEVDAANGRAYRCWQIASGTRDGEFFAGSGRTFVPTPPGESFIAGATGRSSYSFLLYGRRTLSSIYVPFENTPVTLPIADNGYMNEHVENISMAVLPSQFGPFTHLCVGYSVNPNHLDPYVMFYVNMLDNSLSISSGGAGGYNVSLPHSIKEKPIHLNEYHSNHAGTSILLDETVPTISTVHVNTDGSMNCKTEAYPTSVTSPAIKRGAFFPKRNRCVAIPKDLPCTLLWSGPIP